MSDDPATRDALEQRFAERLLDDERLRADLTDDEFQPLQDWALDRLRQCALALADPAAPDADTALEGVVASLRAVLRAANDALGHRFDLDAEGFTAALAPIVEAVEPALYGAEGPANQARLALEAAIPTLVARKDDEDGAALSAALVAALTPTEPLADAASIDAPDAAPGYPPDPTATAEPARDDGTSQENG